MRPFSTCSGDDLLTNTTSCVLAILWFEPNRAGEQRVLPFVLVTAFDLLALLVFLFQRQIDRWRVVLTPDIEQACGAAGEVEGKGQESLRSAAAEPETPQTEARLRVMDNLGYNVRAVNRAGLGAPSLLTRPRSGNTVQLSDGSGGSDLVTVGNAASRRRPSAAITALSPTSAGLSFAALHSVQEMGDDEIVRGQPPKRFSKMILALGMDGGASSLQHACSPDSAVSPATIMSEIHPAMRPAPTDPGRTRTAASRRSESHPPTDPKTCEPSQV